MSEEVQVATPTSEWQSIQLDCPPGSPRPWDLIRGVIEGTRLDTPDFIENVGAFFGAAQWDFDIPREEWERDIQPIIKPRIEALFHSGAIRYGSW